MKFLSIKLDNFMSHKQTHIQLNDLGLVGVEGKNTESGYTDSNGAGKSALIEGLVWCLFGNTIRALKDKDDIVNNLTKKDCSVTVELIQGESYYRITRFRKHSKSGNALNIFQSEDPSFVDIQDVTRSNNTDTQLFIDRLLGLEYQSFVNAIVFGQGDLKHFSQATDAERKLMFEKLLNLEIYTACLEVTKERLETAESELEVLERDIQFIDSQIQRTNSEIEALRVKAENYLAEHEAKIARLKNERDAIPDETNTLSSIQEEVVQLKQQSQEKQEEYRKKQSVFQESIRKKLMKKSALEAQIKEKQSRYEKLRGLGSECPTCEGQVDPARIKGILGQLESDIESQESMKGILFTNIQELNKDLRILEEEFSKQFSESQSRVSLKEMEITNIRIRLNQRQSLQRQIDEAETFQEPYSELIEKKLLEIDELEGKKGEKRGLQITNLEKIERLKFWIDGFGIKGIKSLVLEDVIPFLNERLNFYSERLTHRDIDISLSSTSQLKSGGTSERMNLVIENNSGGKNYESCSSGERRRIDACLLFALLDLAMQRTSPCNILFIDEIFDVLDEVGVDTLIGLLWMKVRDVGLESIIVISHNKEILRALPATFKVTKEHGYSRIE